ncbi:electron transfer flavoprotein subunit alpha/FixB family protein [Muricomes intestini]|jgi:electron transfer flavoprotein alpha subunit|uniref:electron transfer flavoprotein subunit alpha/FixB family protein n=1 Tax=Muricomes intestini TaxID=1796634 RepID=UPI002FDE75C3
MMDKSLYKGIWIFAEQKEGILNGTPLELLAKAIELKKINGDEITALLLGNHVEPLADTLISYGADQVIVIDHPVLKEYKTIPYTEATVKMIKKYKPSIFLFGATTIGRDLAPRIMARLGTGLTADCLDLKLEKDGTLVQTKPSYGGNIMCTITIPDHRPQMSTVRPKVFTAIHAEPGRTGKIVLENIDVTEDESTQVLSVSPKETNGEPIDKAEIIVAGGRGIKAKEELALLEELAKLIGGRVAVSRPLVDEKWMTHEDQIGQSGNTVKARFILNIGISGAVQYIVGMQNSDCIVTINKNPTADIFHISSYGAVADYSELLPAIITEIKKRK